MTLFRNSPTSTTPALSRKKWPHWISLGAAALVATFILGSPGGVRAEERINVVLDQAKIMQLPPNAKTIIIGNPLIAAVTMINRNTQLILTGKSYGQTNMIALDAKGNWLGESTIVVKNAKSGLLVQRGMVQETYSCEPRCQPTVTLGDSAKFSTGALVSSKSRADAAAAAASGAKK